MHSVNDIFRYFHEHDPKISAVVNFENSKHGLKIYVFSEFMEEVKDFLEKRRPLGILLEVLELPKGNLTNMDIIEPIYCNNKSGVIVGYINPRYYKEVTDVC